MFVVKAEGHIHKFGKVYKKVVPLRRVTNEDGKTTRDIISARDTIYYRKCEGKDCKETQPFHLTREVV